MHGLHIFGTMSLLGQELSHRRRNRVDEADEVAKRDLLGRADAICLVLLDPRVPERDLLLVVEPCLIVGTAASVEDPLTEACAYPL
jgi:hypothetical protein